MMVDSTDTIMVYTKTVLVYTVISAELRHLESTLISSESSVVNIFVFKFRFS